MVSSLRQQLFVAAVACVVFFTNLGAASFAPSFFPSGDRILFSSNHGDPKGREFEIWAVNVDGSGLERITWSEGFDGFPLFSPDGTRLPFSSNRHQSKLGETNGFVAQWVEGGQYMADVRWLADDAREGRGVGTKGLEEASGYLERRFKEIGIEPARFGERMGESRAHRLGIAPGRRGGGIELGQERRAHERRASAPRPRSRPRWS